MFCHLLGCVGSCILLVGNNLFGVKGGLGGLYVFPHLKAVSLKCYTYQPV